MGKELIYAKDEYNAYKNMHHNPLLFVFRMAGHQLTWIKVLDLKKPKEWDSGNIPYSKNNFLFKIIFQLEWRWSMAFDNELLWMAKGFFIEKFWNLGNVDKTKGWIPIWKMWRISKFIK